MALFRRWRGASGITLKAEECSVIMGTGEEGRCSAALAQCDDARNMQLVTQTVCLGVNIGPGAASHQWGSVWREIEKQCS